MAVSIEAWWLGNGVDNVVNATLEASENFISQWRDRETNYCSFAGIKRKIWTEYLISNTFTNRNYGSKKHL